MARRKHQRKKTLLTSASADARSLRALGAEYVAWMEVKNYSLASAQTAETGLLNFVEWAEARSLSQVDEVTRPILERYQRWLFYYRKKNGQPLGVSSQASYLSTLRGFFRWVTRQGLLLHNPASELEMPRRHKRLPSAILSPAQVESILALADVTTPVGLRDRAILETLYSTGMRRKELAELGVFSVDGQRGTVMIRLGKGGKDRLIPIGARAVQWVEKYLSDVRPTLVLGRDTGALFLSAYGLAFTADELTHLVGKYVRRAGVAQYGSCHLFRHSMATAMLEGGADIRFIQQMLGHARLDTTELYTRVSIQKLKDIHAATHPAARAERKANSKDTDDGNQVDALLSSLAAEAVEEDESASSE